MAKKTKLNYRMLITLGIISAILIVCLCYLYIGQLEESPTIYKARADKALAQTPKNYGAAIAALSKAVNLSDGSAKLDYQYQVAQLFIERATKEPNLRKTVRDEYFSTGYNMLKGILRVDENHTEALSLLTEHFWARAVYAKKWDVWREYIELINRLLESKEDAKLYYRRAYALSSQARQDSSYTADAIKSFQKAIELAPEKISYRTGMARFYESIKDNARAEEIYKQAIKDIPNKAEVRIEYAMFLRRNDRKAESKKLIQQAIDCDKESATGYLALARLSLQDRDLAKANWAISQAEKIDPNQLQIYLIKSRISKSQNNYEASAQALRDGLSSITDRKATGTKMKYPIGQAKAMLNYWLADTLLDIYQRSTDPEKKKKALEEARLCNRELLKYAPDEPGQLKIAGQLEFADGNYQKAKELLEKASIASGDIKTAARLMEVYKRLRLPTRAETLGQKILASPGNHSNVYFLIQLAQFRIDARDYKTARDYLDRVLNKDPDNKPAKLLLEGIAAAQGRLGADAEMTEVVRGMYLRRAEDLQMAEKLELAAVELEKIIAKRPGDIVAISRLLPIYVEMEQKDKAKALLNRAIAESDEKIKPGLKRWLALLEESDSEKRLAIELGFADATKDPLRKALEKYILCRRYGKNKQAAKYLDEAYEINPNSLLVIRLKMLQALGGKDYPKAMEIIKPLEKINVQEWHLMKANILMAEAKYDDAIVNLDEYLRSKSYSQVANLLLGDCYFNKGEFEKARKQYGKCIANDGKDIKAMVGLAKVSLAQNKILEHDRWVRKAYSYPAGKRHPYIYEQYVRLNIEPKNVSKAIAAREKKFKEQPENLSNASRLGALYESQGSIDKARDIFEYVYKRVPSKVTYSGNLANFYARHNMTTKADELFNELIAAAKTPGDKVGAYIAYGNFLVQFDQAAAQGMFEKALSVSPEDLRPLKVLANLFSAQAMRLAREGKEKESRLKWKSAIDKLRVVIKLDPSDTQTKLNLYRLYIDAGMLSDAIAGYKRILQDDPENVNAMLGLGLTLLKKGKIKEAIAEFKIAINRFPNMPDAYIFRSEAYRAQGELALAIEDLRKAIQYSNNVTYKMDLATLYLANDNAELAEATYSGIIASPDSQNYYPAYERLVKLLLKNRRWAPLENVCKKGKEVFPKLPVFYLALAEMWNIRSENRSRIAELEKAIKIDRGNPRVVTAYMEALYEAKSYRVLGQVIKFYEAQPGFAVLATAYKGMLYKANNEPERAKEILLLALRRSQDPNMTALVIRLMSKSFGDAQVIADTKAIIQAKPDDWVVLVSLSSVAMRQKEYKKCHVLLMDALKVVSGTGGKIRILSQLAQMYEKTKNIEGVEKAYTEILKVDPRNIMALNNLAYLYVNDFKRPQQALPLIERAMAARPGDQNLIDTYAWTLALNGEYSRAEGFLEEILRRGSKGPDALYHMGYVKEKLGKYKYAKDYYRRARELAKDKNIPMVKDIQAGIKRVDAKLAEKNQENK